MHQAWIAHTLVAHTWAAWARHTDRRALGTHQPHPCLHASATLAAEQQKATDQPPRSRRRHGAEDWRRHEAVSAGCKVWYWLLGKMGTGSRAMFAPVCRIQGLAKTATAGSVQHSPNSALHRVRAVQPALLQLSSALRTLGKRLKGTTEHCRR